MDAEAAKAAEAAAGGNGDVANAKRKRRKGKIGAGEMWIWIQIEGAPSALWLFFIDTIMECSATLPSWYAKLPIQTDLQLPKQNQAQERIIQIKEIKT